MAKETTVSWQHSTHVMLTGPGPVFGGKAGTSKHDLAIAKDFFNTKSSWDAPVAYAVPERLVPFPEQFQVSEMEVFCATYVLGKSTI